MGQRPPCVDVLNNRCDRAAICKIHICAQPLMIERGRHLNITRTERYCLLCKSNQIEDEKHFLLHCKKFNTQRNIFNEKISKIYCLKHPHKVVFDPYCRHWNKFSF
jgi:flavoprotein